MHNLVEKNIARLCKVSVSRHNRYTDTGRNFNANIVVPNYWLLLEKKYTLRHSRFSHGRKPSKEISSPQFSTILSMLVSSRKL